MRTFIYTKVVQALYKNVSYLVFCVFSNVRFQESKTNIICHGPIDAKGILPS